MRVCHISFEINEVWHTSNLYRIFARNDLNISMDYITKINKRLQPKIHLDINVLDLFAGCGGLSLGFEEV